MSIFLGSDSIVRAFYTVPNSVPLSGSTTQIVSSSYISGAIWPSLTGSAVDTIGAPFAGQAADGKWQLNVSGTLCNAAKYLIFSSSLMTGKYAQTRTQPFTILFNGTLDGIGSNGVSRYGQGLFGNPMYVAGNDACDIIIRTDTTQSGYADIDWRSSRAGSGEAARFTIDCVSGSVYNLAFVKDSSEVLKMYQNGVLVGSASSAGWLYGFNLFTTASVLNDTSYRGMQFGLVAANGCGSQDTFAYQGKLGAIGLYNRELSQVEIQQASQAYYGLQNGQGYALPISSSYLGSDLVYVDVPPTTTTTTTTTTTSTTTTSTTTTTTTAAPPASMSVQTLVIGGGGSGGCGTGGGGGAGGVVYSSSLSMTPGTYTINVGSGGLATGSNGGFSPSGRRGQDSSIVSGSIIVSASGGGGGKGFDVTLGAANNGGSGGGGTANSPSGGVGISGQGFNGGTWNGADNGCGSGGGGAAQAGRSQTTAYPNGNGGAGGSGSAYTIRSGTSVFYGGGGGGGNYVTSNLVGAAGVGGGTAGSKTTTNPTSASANTGGGGGGSFRSAIGDNNGISGNGGSGIVVIAYLTASYSSSGVTAVSGGIVTDYTSGSLVYRSHTFLSSSNLVIS